MRSTYDPKRLRSWPALLLLGASLAACGGSRDPVLGIDGNILPPPMVTSVSPAAGAADVAIDIVAITATFSEPMAPFTGDASFTVSCAAPCTSPIGTTTVNAQGTTARFTPAAALENSTTYSATISGARSQTSGLALVEDVTWNFTTIAPPPTVTALAPANGATGVPVNNTVITAQFSEPVDDLATGDLTVTCAAPCTSPAGTVSTNSAGTIATFTVSDSVALEAAALYTATVVMATSRANGQGLEMPFVWTFSTGVVPDTTRPRVISTVPQTTNPGPTLAVPTNTGVTATFSEAMAPATISAATFTLTCEAPCVSPTGMVTYAVGSRTAVFTPQSGLEPGANYTAIIESEVTDLAGNRLAGNQEPIANPSDYIWTFTTDVAVPPDNLLVQATAPISGGTLPVCPDASVNATVDVPSGLRLDPTTVTSLTFQLVENATPLNVVIAESVVLDVDTGTIMTFTPQEQLTDGVVYRATIKGGQNGIKDLAVPANQLVEDLVWTFTAVGPVESCLVPVDLNSAAPFGTFGGSAGMTNQGLLTIVNGDIGTTAVSTAVTGFVSEPGCEYTITPLNQGQVNGRIYTAPPPPTVGCPQDGTAITQGIANQARLDAETAYNDLTPANLPGGLDPGNDNLGSLTLAPGIWTAQSGSFLIQGGNLTLDGQGNQNAVWVFQMATTLGVGEAAVPRSVILINGAQAKNVFWQVGSAATINPSGGGTMKGTILAQSGVTFSTAGNVDIVTLDGRALSLGASVTMVNTIINVPAP